MTSYVRSPLNFAAHQRATVGDQKISFTGFDHLGWLKCDGRSVSRATYALLFNVIGETFGADDSTTFKLPNYQGCVPGMPGTPPVSDISGANPTTYLLGDLEAGEQRHKLIIDEMPAHKHGSVDVSDNTNGDGLTASAGSHNHGGVTGPGGNAIESENVFGGVGANVSGAGEHTHSISTDGAHQHAIGSTGGSDWHNNMQPTLFGGNMFIFSGRMTTTRSSTGGNSTYPYAQGTDLA